MKSILNFQMGVFVFLLAACAGVIGCYSQSSVVSGTASVVGRVTLDKAPLGQAKVVFLPTQLRSDLGEIMPIAYGISDSEGRFQLAYRDGSKELLMGRYNVLVSRVEGSRSEPGRIAFGESGSPSLTLVNSMIARSSVGPISKFESDERFQVQVVPAIYNVVSELYFELDASAEVVEANFELTSVDPVLLKSR